METNKKSLVVNAIIYGCILGGIYVVISLLYYIFSVNVLSIGFSILSTLITFGILVVFMILGANAYRDKSLDGKINYGLAFLSCLIIGFIGFIISGIYSYVFYKYFDPQMLVQMHDRAMEMIQNNPGIPPERMDKMMNRLDKNLSTSGMILSSLKMAVIGSVIFALIVSLFIKKEKEQRQ
jgi:hypothetical protein